MAKSKNGGTRSYLRGRIANDVYSIGKDSKGKKQQVVRSLAEQVNNPRTIAQMRGRMYMSTVMQTLSQLSALIDHSFDGVAAGQPSLSEFIRLNYALVKADAIAHPNGGNQFGLNLFGEKGSKGGAYIVSAGKAVLPAAVIASDSDKKAMEISLGSAAPTVADLQTTLGIAAGDYFTKVVILSTGIAIYYRVFFAPTIAADTVISADNVASLFTIAGNVSVAISFTSAENGSTIVFTPAAGGDVLSHGIIVSQTKNGGWIHSDTTLENVGTLQYTSAVALPTYPVGERRFLNGGDADGSIASGEGDDTAVVIGGSFATLTVGGIGALSSGAPVFFGSTGSKAVAGTIAGADANRTYTVNAVPFSDSTGVGSVVANVSNGSISGSLDIANSTDVKLVLVCDGQRLDESTRIGFDDSGD